MAKRPAPGQTKTRLAPPLAPGQAAALYEAFLRDTVELMREVPGIHPAIAYLPAQERAYFEALAPDFELIEQQGSDLGTRLDEALAHYLSRGYRRVVIMNSDSPNLPAAFLPKAFQALADAADVVLGPCDDGGYYLIGLSRPAPRLLREVPMSTPHVLTDTMEMAHEEGLAVALLPAWYDVDDAAGLARLAADLSLAPSGVACHTRATLQSISW